MEGHIVVEVVWGEIPEENGVSLARADLQISLWEVSLASLVHVREVHQNSSNALSSASNVVHTVRISAEPVGVRLVLLAVLVAQQIEYFSIFLGQESPLSNAFWRTEAQKRRKRTRNCSENEN